MILRGVVALLLVAVAPVTLSADALGDQPVSSTFTESVSAVFARCDGFNVIETAVVRGRDTVYLDRDGHQIRHVVRLRVSGTFSHSVTAEVISTDHAAFMIDEGLRNDEATKEGPRPGTTRTLGLEFQIKIDGAVVAVDAGQLFIDIHDHDNPFDDEVLLQAGRRDVADGFDFCAASA